VSDVYAAIDQLVISEGFAVTSVCQTLQVSRSGFAAWRSERTSQRADEDARLTPVIQDIFWHHRRRYGARRIAQELARRDIACGVARVARLMKTLDLQAIQAPRFRPQTTDSRHTLGYSPNLLIDREAPKRLNEVWVADITYIPLRTQRFGYLALLMDLCSRTIVGWSYDSTMDERLSLAALRRGLRVRSPETTDSDSPVLAGGGTRPNNRFRQLS